MGNYSDQFTPQLLPSFSSSPIQSISCGYHHTIVSTEEGKVYSWGRNYSGELGLGDRNNRNTPHEVKIPNHSLIAFVKAGYFHSIAVSKKGEIFVWGYSS